MSRLADPRLLLGLGCLALLAAYWPGLQGGFLLDDTENFAQLERFANGDVTWVGPVVSNASGPLGRPISMASFVATVAAGGHSPWAYKVGNLFLHLSIGALMGILAVLVLRRDPRLAPRAELVATLVAVLWMVLPIHVSTVLYPVQRMAQMSTLFLAGGLISYVVLRQRLEASPSSIGLQLALPASVGLFTVLGAFSKENGLLLPLLCAAAEISLFARATAGRRAAAATMAVLLIAPAAVGTIFAALNAERFFGAYDIRSFTLVERLLTQPRVLWDYIGNIIVPNGARLGVYQDDFPVSRSLWEPWTTVPAALGWLAMLAGAIRWRAAAPVAACGILLFLGGHAMESTIFPLEIYFEHRNYFSAIGVLLAMAGVAPMLRQRLVVTTPAVASFLRIAPFAWFLMLVVAVHARATVWGSPETLVAQSEASRPQSPRVQSTLAARAMERGDLAAALHHIDAAERLAGMVERGSTSLWRVIAHCETGTAIPPSLIKAAEDRLQPTPTTFGLRAAILLSERVEAGKCAGLDATAGHELFARWLALLAVDRRNLAAWRIRYATARLAAASGQWRAAQTLSRQAWEDSNWNTGVGVLVIQIANSMGDRKGAEEAIELLAATAPTWDLRIKQVAERFRNHLDSPTRSANVSDNAQE